MGEGVRSEIGEGLIPARRALRHDRGEGGPLPAACQADQGPQGARDAALFALGFGSGLRRAELVDRDLSDFVSDSGELKVRRGKGRKARVAHVSPGRRRPHSMNGSVRVEIFLGRSCAL